MKYKSIQDIPTEKLEEEVNSAALMYWTYATPNFEIENWYFKKEGYKKGINSYFWERLEEKNPGLNTLLQSKNPQVLGQAYAKLQRLAMARYQDKNKELVDNFLYNKKDLYNIYRKKKYEHRPETTLNQTVNTVNDLSLIIFNEIQKKYGVLTGQALDEFKKDQNFLGKNYADEEFAKSEFEYEQNKQSFLLAARVKSEFHHINKKYLIEESLVETPNGEICNVSYRNGVYFIGEGDVKDCSFSILQKNEKDGTPKFYITFRGTDTNIKSFGLYAIEDYKNMGSHYEKLAAVFRKVLENIEKDNPKFKVKVIGHSLGASMVERFMKEYPDTENIQYEGLALASPGQEHWAQGLVDYIDKRKEQIDKFIDKFDPIMCFIANLSDNRITRYIALKFEQLSNIKDDLMEYASQKADTTKNEEQVKYTINNIGKSMDFLSAAAGKFILFLASPTTVATTLAYAGIMGQISLAKVVIGKADKLIGLEKSLLSADEDERILKVDNRKDIVPKAGALINRQHNKPIIIENIPEKNLFNIPVINLPVKLETDYHDKALYFMPFVEEYAKRQDVAESILKDRIKAVLEEKKGIDVEIKNENESIINLTLDQINQKILNFKKSNMSVTNVLKPI